MAIAVICPGCNSRFSVSDQFAGQTGPCPKCKKPIKIPAVTAEAVVIHEPEAPVTSSTGTGRAPTAPIRRLDKPIGAMRFVAVGAAAVAALAAAWGTGLMVKPADLSPLLLLVAAFLVGS